MAEAAALNAARSFIVVVEPYFMPVIGILYMCVCVCVVCTLNENVLK